MVIDTHHMTLGGKGAPDQRVGGYKDSKNQNDRNDALKNSVPHNYHRLCYGLLRDSALFCIVSAA